MRLEDLDVSHRFATTNGLRVHYVEKGEPGRPLVLLLHGFPDFWWSWRHQIDPLVEAGFRVVAPDQRGYGDTDKHGPYDLDTLVEDVVGLIEALGEERAIVVGHDWGGAVAWHLAATRPSRCAKLAILNSPHPVVFQRALRSPAQLRKSWYMFVFQIPFLPELLLRRDRAAQVARVFRASAFGGGADAAHLDDESLAPYREAILKPGAAQGMVGWYRASMRGALKNAVASALGRKTRGPYPVIEAETLLLWALDDFALGFDECVPGTERYVKHLEVRTLDRCGHFLQTEAPERVTPILVDFLRGRTEPRRKAG